MTILKAYNFHDSKAIEAILSAAEWTFKLWKNAPINTRTAHLETLAKLLIDRKERYGLLMTREMGKPITQSDAEIEKCALLCRFYHKNAEHLLADELIETEAQQSFISYDPLGVILGVMPWNFPFWQVMRFAVPTLMTGNTVVLKHATSVTGCALALQELFEDAGFPKDCFQTVLANHEQVEHIIADDRVKAVSLTGSEAAGRHIASAAGKHLKKCVLELGGNNACIILKDADLDKYMDTIVNARMQNTGQSCIASKRFIVEEAIYNEFLQKFKAKIESLRSGNPEDAETNIGVLARPDLADILEKKVQQSVEQGAEIYFGNTRKGTDYQPTILTKVSEKMPVFTEETFGPVASVIKVKNEAEAFRVNANTKFGLGTMLITENIDKAIENIGAVEDGAFFINELVKSDPRLPFGGTKASGYGRELSREGLLEFVNKKTVYIMQ